MKVTYSRAGGETRVFEYDSDDMLMGEVKAIEKAAGMPLDMFEMSVKAGGYTERLIMLWVLMRRENPKLRMADLESTVKKKEITVEFNRAERAATREQVMKMKGLSDDDRDMIIAQLDAEDAEDDEPTDEQEAPKGLVVDAA